MTSLESRCYRGLERHLQELSWKGRKAKWTKLCTIQQAGRSCTDRIATIWTSHSNGTHLCTSTMWTTRQVLTAWTATQIRQDSRRWKTLVHYDAALMSSRIFCRRYVLQCHIWSYLAMVKNPLINSGVENRIPARIILEEF